MISTDAADIPFIAMSRLAASLQAMLNDSESVVRELAIYGVVCLARHGIGTRCLVDVPVKLTSIG